MCGRGGEAQDRSLIDRDGREEVLSRNVWRVEQHEVESPCFIEHKLLSPDDATSQIRQSAVLHLGRHTPLGPLLLIFTFVLDSSSDTSEMRKSTSESQGQTWTFNIKDRLRLAFVRPPHLLS